MIRIDADLFDMTIVDLADTIPFLSRDISEWTIFGQNTTSAQTSEICDKKVRFLTQRKTQMENRLASLKLVSA